MYDNFKQTFDIYDRIIEVEKTNGKGASIQADLKPDEVGIIKYDSSNPQNASTLGIKNDIEKHPFAYSDNNDFIDKNGKQYKIIQGIKVGSIGVVISENKGDRNIDDSGNVTVTPDENITLITQPNIVSKTSTAITESTRNYIENAISEYYDIMSNKDDTKEEKDRAFEKLYNTLNNLFGNASSKIFNGFFIVKDKTGDRFSICISGINGWNPAISLIKYSRLYKDNGVYKTDKGKIVSGQDLMGFYSGTTYFPIEDQLTKKVSHLKKDTRRKLISSVINSIVDTMTFITTCYAIDKKQGLNIESEHIKTYENGKIYIMVDTYENLHYNSFNEIVVDLNMYKFSQVGSRYDNYFKYDDLPKSFFLDINKEQTKSNVDVTEEQLKKIF